MEELNKNQIVLLTLLVSFVTSIATGIVTVSLVDQAPPGVTQTINKVVEKTIETVVPVKNEASIIVTKEVPVVVKEENLIVKAIEQNTNSLVRIKEIQEDGSGIFITLGLVVSKDGEILVDRAFFDLSKKFSATFADGHTFGLQRKEILGKSVLLFQTIIPESEKIKYIFSPAVLGDSDGVRLGQSVVALGGNKERNHIGVGVISSIVEKTEKTEGLDKKILEQSFPSILETSIKNVIESSFLLDLSGKIVGMDMIREDFSLGDYLSINLVKEQIQVISATTTRI